MKVKVDQYAYLDSAALFSFVARQPWALFLDSGVLPGKMPVSVTASYDVLAIKPAVTIVTHGDLSIVTEASGRSSCSGDPLSLLQARIPTIDDAPELAYLPGAIGYFSYDLVRYFEQLPELAENDEQLPEMAMGVYHAVVVIDHIEKLSTVIYLQGSESAQELRTEWRQLINDCLNDDVSTQPSARLSSAGFSENMTRLDYQQRFARVRQYTIDGDCYQVNLAKRFSADVEGDSWRTYDRLRNLSPAPYGAFLNFPFAQILSNSPESFIRCRAGAVTTRPIKGTRPRDHQDKMNDRKIALQLKNSEKDKAENLMIVDLMRNDLSRCCELGSVRVPTLFALHSFANVHHLISTIVGTLRQGLHALDLLRVCFPGGSITGAPKIRAMEIIEELEPHRRGIYCGAIGYVGVDGSLETNIAIRTITVKDGVARYSAGGGLVIDSNVDEEYQEVIDKASMMSQSLGK